MAGNVGEGGLFAVCFLTFFRYFFTGEKQKTPTKPCFAAQMKMNAERAPAAAVAAQGRQLVSNHIP